MTYLISVLWFPLLLALALGGLVGMSSFARQPRSETAWLYLTAVIGAVALLLAAFKTFPGRAGLWLDATLLLAAAYFIGCLLGAWFKARGQEPARFQPVAAGAGAGPIPAAMPKPAAPEAAHFPVPAVVNPPVPAAETATAPVALAGAAASGQPAGMPKPRGEPDDLKRVRGIGRQNEGRLHALGIWHFDQIAAWTDKEIAWVEGFLAFPGRIHREDWVGQAKVLAAGGQTEFSQRVERGEVETSADDGTHGQTNIDPGIDPKDPPKA